MSTHHTTTGTATRTAADAATLAALEFDLDCELVEYHAAHGDGPAVCIAYVTPTCAHTPPFLLLCDGCLQGLMDPGAVAVVGCRADAHVFRPASRWLLMVQPLKGGQ